ncbi:MULTISPECIES: hypothetical protein [Serratia]|uniref:Uncharacterized protein n=1 Tax=Serratia fonticola TaxID=47917 RepID=A0AAW3WV89_SERFO|nr:MULTISPECIES: hypothetical protein [Serratia]MBC3214659.1 hypothetical protein [Serratia fonticola]NYA15140.1 hypothetical protein [Serratia fonticola]NYA35400.1 hypothetical protein [Serratia fonticola]
MSLPPIAQQTKPLWSEHIDVTLNCKHLPTHCKAAAAPAKGREQQWL